MDLEELLKRCQLKGGAIIVSGIGGIGYEDELHNQANLIR